MGVVGSARAGVFNHATQRIKDAENDIMDDSQTTNYR